LVVFIVKEGLLFGVGHRRDGVACGTARHGKRAAARAPRRLFRDLGTIKPDLNVKGDKFFEFLPLGGRPSFQFPEKRIRQIKRGSHKSIFA
jgi:hypothetical protein